MARNYRHPAWGPFTVKVRNDSFLPGWEDCDLPNGELGWCVYLNDVDKNGSHSRDLSHEASQEIRAWLGDTLGLDKATIDDNLYAWGVTFEHQDQALLCFLHYK